MDKRKLAIEVLENLGGSSNVKTCQLYATGIIVEVNDLKKVNEGKLQENEEIIEVEIKDRIYLVTGTEAVDVYEAFIKEASINNESEIYNRAKIWQIGLFSLNNTATNFYMFLTGFITYYCVGVAGLLTAVVGIILTGIRIFDGITDPIIGFLIDKTDGKFGKFRPFMVLGNVIMILATFVMLQTTHLVPEELRYLYFIFIYGIYIIGYTFQTACTKAGQACLTNDPKQRPIFSMFDGVFVTVIFMGLQIIVSNVLIPMTGGFNQQFFNLAWVMTALCSAVLTLLAIIGIWKKDRTEFFGTGVAQKIKFKEYWDVIKNNRAIQMLVVSASTDKLAMTIGQNAILTTILYGILVGNYALSGQISLITLLPTLFLGLWGMNFSRKTGMKKAIVVASWLGIIVTAGMALFVYVVDMGAVSLSSLNMITIIFILFLIVRGAVNNVSGNIVIPMIADCADYETYRTGRYVPGMMGTLFSFVDKIISSFATTVITLSLAFIGYANTLPQIGDPVTNTIKTFYVVMAFGVPILGLVCNVIAMKFYPLSREKMIEVQTKIREIKEQNI